METWRNEKEDMVPPFMVNFFPERKEVGVSLKKNTPKGVFRKEYIEVLFLLKH
jgi:hypothetical protein